LSSSSSKPKSFSSIRRLFLLSADFNILIIFGLPSGLTAELIESWLDIASSSSTDTDKFKKENLRLMSQIWLLTKSIYTCLQLDFLCLHVVLFRHVIVWYDWIHVWMVHWVFERAVVELFSSLSLRPNILSLLTLLQIRTLINLSLLCLKNIVITYS